MAGDPSFQQRKLLLPRNETPHFIVGQVVPLATVVLVVAAVEEIVGVEEVVEISVCSWECACFPLPFVLLSQ